MIYFITRRTDHDPLIYKSAKIKVFNTFEVLEQLFTNLVLQWDCEANGKRYHQTELLLYQIGNKTTQVVIDMTEPPHLIGWRKEVISALNRLITPNHVFIGHNLKYDINTVTPYGIKVPIVRDTMISEQRINLGSGLLANLEDTFERRLNKFFEVDKRIRKEFTEMDKSSRMLLRHIMYSANDVVWLEDILEEQRKILSSTGQLWFTSKVEFPLVKILSEMELQGIDVDSTIWASIIDRKWKEKIQCQRDMDSIVLDLGAKSNNAMYLKAGKFNKNRKKVQLTQTSIFGDRDITIENKNTHNTNYNSRLEIFKIIEKLELPIPTFMEGKEEKDSLKEEAIMTYLMMNPNTPLKSFFQKLLEYKGLQKFLSSYGEKFLKSVIYKKGEYQLGYVNPVTNRVHTLFKQCVTDTGRLASGEKDEGLFNIQNLPAEKEIRQAFKLTTTDIAAGYHFSTVDLSGAELIIMAAFANDTHLYELGADKIIDGVKVEGDLHSPVSTKCWRAVYTYRKAKLSSYLSDLAYIGKKPSQEELDNWFIITDSKGKKYTLTEDFQIIKDKKHPNIQLRTDFKSYTFGVFYGMMAKKGGETLNIPKEEAQVMIDVIRKEFPKTIKMLEAAVRQAFRYGYVIFNNRSNNRRTFKEVQDILKTINTSKYSDDMIIDYVKENLSFMQQVAITGEALNCRIQGTQADMIKESLVEIRNHPDYDLYKAKLVLSVHDENGAKHLGTTFGDTMASIMKEVANRYLTPYSNVIKMGAEAQTLHCWTK